MELRTIVSGTDAYNEMVQLRIRALLEPIGVPAHYIDREKEKNDIFIAAYEQGHMIGCCVLTPKNHQVIQLRQMAVAPEHQGNGFGKLIIHFAENVAIENKFQILMMHSRDPVIGFYEKCGYHISGEPFFEVGMGHHKMEKKLGHV